MSVVNLFQNIAGLLSFNLNFSEPSLFNDSDYFSLATLDFSESGLKIKQIIESVYTDGITGLDNIEVKGQNIVGTFSDYISPALTNKFSFEITPDNVSYQLINPGSTSYSEYLDFAKPNAIPSTGAKTKADKSGRTRSCNPEKSITCGASCIQKGKKCSGQSLTPELKQAQKEIISSKTKAEVDPKATSKTKKAIAGLTEATESNSLLDRAIKSGAGITNKTSQNKAVKKAKDSSESILAEKSEVPLTTSRKTKKATTGLNEAGVAPKATSKTKKAIAGLTDATESNSLLGRAVKSGAGVTPKKSRKKSDISS